MSLEQENMIRGLVLAGVFIGLMVLGLTWTNRDLLIDTGWLITTGMGQTEKILVAHQSQLDTLQIRVELLEGRASRLEAITEVEDNHLEQERSQHGR